MASNVFANTGAAIGRGLLYAYLRVCYRPKIIYLDSDSKALIRKGGNVIISNHVGHNDGQMLYMLFKGSCITMAKDWLEKGIVKWITTGGLFISVDRFGMDITWVRQAAEMLKGGKNVVIFPEGHTSKTGMNEFKPGFAMAALMGNADVIPVYIDGQYNCLFGKRLRVYVGRRTALSLESKGLNANYLAGQSGRFYKIINDMKGEISK